MTGDDPNEAYEVVPTEPGPHGRLVPGGPSSGTASRFDTFPARKKLSYTRPIQNIEQAICREGMGEGEGGNDRERPAQIFTIEIGDTPTLTFEVQTLREAQELCHEQRLKDDLAEAKSPPSGRPSYSFAAI